MSSRKAGILRGPYFAASSENMTLNLRHLLFVMMILMGAVGRGAAPHGSSGVVVPAVEAVGGEGDSSANTDDCQTCYSEGGKLTKLEKDLSENPQIDEELKKAVSGFIGLARERSDDPNMRRWVHENLEQLYPSEANEESSKPTIPQWVKSNLVEAVPPVSAKPQSPAPPAAVPAPASGTPVPVVTAPTPPSQIQPPQLSIPPENTKPNEVAVKPPTERPSLFPAIDSLSALKPWLMHPVPQMPEIPVLPENPEGRLVWAPKPMPNATQNTFSEKPTIAPPNLPSTLPSTQGFSNQSAPSANLSPISSPKPFPNLAAALPAQAAPPAVEAVTAVAPTVVVISQAAPQQMALSEKTLEKPGTEKSFAEKNNLKSEGGNSPSAGFVPTQNTQPAASLPAPQNITASELKALSPSKKASGILPDLSSAFGKLKEILHGKKTGTGSAQNQVVLNQPEKAQSEKDPWAVERSPSSWESNGGGLESPDKGISLISFASFKAWAGMAAAISALMAFFAYLFYKKQTLNRKPTWVEVIIDHPALRKRPARKVKSLTGS